MGKKKKQEDRMPGIFEPGIETMAKDAAPISHVPAQYQDRAIEVMCGMIVSAALDLHHGRSKNIRHICELAEGYEKLKQEQQS